MVDPVTPNRGYAVPVRGSDVGTWDVPVNGDFTLIDQNLGAVSTIGLSNINVVLGPSQYACGTIRLTGALTADVTVTFPLVSGWWVVDNQTTGVFDVQLICNAGGSKIGVPKGVASDVLTDGINIAFRNLPEAGVYRDFAGTTVPRWVNFCTVAPWLNCDGSAFSAVTYPYLNVILGGTTLPDLRGVARYTLNQGTGRLTTAGSGLDGNTRFSLKTSQANVIQTSNLPPYTPAGSISTSTTDNDLVQVNGVTSTSLAGGGGGFGWNNVPTVKSLLASLNGTFSSLFTGTAQGGTSAPFGVIGTGTVAGITMIRAA